VKSRLVTEGLVAAVVVLLLLNSGCIIVDSVSGVSQTRELQKSGRPATAVILRISDSGTTVNDDPVVYLDLEVHPDAGPAFGAMTKCLISRLDVPQFQPGRTIPVRYDPADHTRVGIDVYKYNW
jgi:hypothetical protein